MKKRIPEVIKLTNTKMINYEFVPRKYYDYGYYCGQVHIEVKRKSNGLPVLSKGDIEEIMEAYLGDFDSKILEDPMMSNLAKVITGVGRFSYANVWEAKSINGGDAKYGFIL
ncbi:hypothetical protein WY13_02188 [Clostridium ljungdahlii]|uniref:Uncharacterized protein n=1 Tax=Clostridium ljungdahlii TaxID=1538 RepID=A0A168NR81_9CLOT|nr:hypothetical protein WY13_02188 [Clostridium ljungdahlii]